MFYKCQLISPVFVFLLLALPISNQTANAPIDKQVVRFCEDVLFETEFAEEPLRFCKLWTSSPKVSTFGPGSHHPRVIENVVKQLNECLPSDLQMKILEPNDQSATLKIYFVPLQQFHDVAKEHGFEAVENWGIFYSFWNGNFEIQEAVVLIAADRVSGRRLNHFVLEEVTQALGFPGDSKRFEKSVFYEDQSRKRYGRATNLSKLDKRLIKFHYKHNRAGQTPLETGLKMAKHWD